MGMAAGHSFRGRKPCMIRCELVMLNMRLAAAASGTGLSGGATEYRIDTDGDGNAEGLADGCDAVAYRRKPTGMATARSAAGTASRRIQRTDGLYRRMRPCKEGSYPGGSAVEVPLA